MKKNIISVIAILVVIIGIACAWIIKNNERQENISRIEDIPQKSEVNNKIEETVINEEEITEKEIESNETEIKEVENTENKITESEKVQEIDKEDASFNLAVSKLDLETLKSYKLPILIDFGSDSCIPCKQMAPVLEELNSELRGKAIIKFVDVWKYPDESKGFHFSLIPTQFFLDKDGNVYTSHTGAITKEEAMKILVEMGMEE